MAAATPWTLDDDQHVRDLAAAGRSVREIGVELGRTKSSVARRMRKLNIVVDRTQTIAATQATMIDAKARRATLEIALLDDAERLRKQLWQPHLYFDWGGKDHDYDEREMPQPTPTDKLKLMQAAGAALDRSLKIAVYDADTGHTEAVSMLGDIAAAINAAADQVEAEQAAR